MDKLVVAIPYPARGHINPMMKFCSLLSLKGISVILVLTEEWLSLIGPPAAAAAPVGVEYRVATVPNVIPSEKDRSKDMMGFFKAVATEMKSAIHTFLDRLDDGPVSCIVADAIMTFMMGFGGRREEDTLPPVASLFPSPASMFFAYYHFDLIMAAARTQVIANSNDTVEEKDTMVIIDNIPFEFPVKSVEISFANLGNSLVNKGIQSIVQTATTTHAILISTYEELEPEFINALRDRLPIPLYAFGPSIPYLSLELKHNNCQHEPSSMYIDWLDACPKASVLYISLGSFETVSDEQMEEISKGLQASKVRYIWSVRGDYTSSLKEDCGELGLIVPWCDQLKVLCHPSVGGFLTHCGWNSVMEAIFAGVPMLTFPLVLDQVHICNIVLNHLRVGLKLKEVRYEDDQNIVSREEVAMNVVRLMDLNENEDVHHDVRKRIKEHQQNCQKAIQSGGSIDVNVTSFIQNIVKNN
ncbi:UDP-glycosyltransferase 87A2-like [Impatiens glandulifera]|uniref:UDP-glycosyltransferase 87A2-like n=1 Tax=Impatiens glandulifera TaxID=253017 RepID=UPI001FB11020|nr:UDP-glycosyltransferase 87A2-like [Impatiens glandulifera]